MMMVVKKVDVPESFEHVMPGFVMVDVVNLIILLHLMIGPPGPETYVEITLYCILANQLTCKYQKVSTGKNQ